MNSVRIKSYAKINLSLDILGKSGDYHLLDSVVANVDIYDLITVTKRSKDKLVSIAMYGMGSQNIPYDQNNAVKAAEAFIQRFGVNGVDISVYKNIPMGAGLGGSSADITGVIRGMAKLYEIEDEQAVCALAESLGSDCRYMMYGGYKRMSGRGEILKDITCAKPLNLFMMLPPAAVSTAACYKAFDSMHVSIPASSQSVEEALAKGDLEALGSSMSNMLMAPAAKLNADIRRCIDQLKAYGPLGVNMTGSGSCVYAIFEDEQLCRYAQSRYYGKFKTLITKTCRID